MPPPLSTPRFSRKTIATTSADGTQRIF